jgi:hypothetical protein
VVPYFCKVRRHNCESVVGFETLTSEQRHRAARHSGLGAPFACTEGSRNGRSPHEF